MNIEGIVATLVIGLVAGWLASFVVGGGGLLRYIVWGVLGAVVGGILLPALGIGINIGPAIVNQIVVATIGAIILVLVARAVA
ncbi:MAG: GlsB/YeaQ/YmgE family stress response membrane protein [Thermohalobaculum sp.]|nr:GlsB/YeaQ/YmgE family stress response membrane protein [Thermohalobaculum sp.]